jgi:copper(I)-binding protein
MLRTILLSTATLTLLLGGAHAQSSTYKVGSLVIEAPWIRATPGGAKVAGGYLKITNTGQQPDRLTGGTLPVATEVEVHEMSMSNGVMKMRKLDGGLEIKSGQSVELKPGGYHLMFTGLRHGLKENETIKGTLVFERSGSVEVEYRVAPIGAKSGGHMHWAQSSAAPALLAYAKLRGPRCWGAHSRGARLHAR